MERLISMKQVQALIGVSRTQIGRYINCPEYVDLGFPQPLYIGIRIFFVEREIQDWIAARITERDAS